VARFLRPVELHPWEALWVTLAGLLINVVSMLILGGHAHSHGNKHTHDHKHDHSHAHKHSHVMAKPAHQHGSQCNHDHGGKDLNMASAYTHVMADALTSVLALFALGGAIWQGWTWLDPLMGLVGAALILKWGVQLMREAGQELLDARSDKLAEADVKKFLNSKGLDSSCVHVWQLDAEKLALHLRVNAVSSDVPEVKNLRQELLARFPVDHLVLEVSSGAADCQLV
jgi:cation diffusion facilitator family transporter